MFGAKVVLWILLGLAAYGYAAYFSQTSVAVEDRAALAAGQLDSDESNTRAVAQEVRMGSLKQSAIYSGTFFAWWTLGVLMFWNDLFGDKKGEDGHGRNEHTYSVNQGMLAILPLLFVSGCGFGGGYDEVKTIEPWEEAFLIPLTENKKQASTDSEELLRQNMVQAKQVRIPQQYVYTGPFGVGDWRVGARLIVVNRAPVTCEWTADPNSGTSNKNEAVWVMTADQVEMSTGWTITAYIKDKDGAVKFLHYYPAGTLEKVLNTEVRAKLQATFGLEVTDLSMEELRKNATPHIEHTIKTVKDFFEPRGISITNLGITGGFIYKDPNIVRTMSEVFQAEQQASMQAAKTAAQREENKRINLAAEAAANAAKTRAEGEAAGIRVVAEAKAYEIEKAQQNKELYISLKRLELETKKVVQWKGEFPKWYMGGGNSTPDMLLQVPAFDTKP